LRWLGATSDGLDGRHSGRRTPASASGEQSAREGELARNETGERERVWEVLKRELGVRGQAAWLGFSAGVRAGPRRFVGKAELTERSHSAERRSGHVGETTHRANETGP
jgi:hypothetical protein